MAPAVSQTMKFLNPAAINSLHTLIPAAPAPFITILSSSGLAPLSLVALSSPARTTTAVPCWSSWNIGHSTVSMSFVSMLKQSGPLISSKLMIQKEGDILWT